MRVRDRLGYSRLGLRKIEDLSGADNTLAQELELLRRLINDQA